MFFAGVGNRWWRGQRVIAEGGCAKVYDAVFGGQRVALKVMSGAEEHAMHEVDVVRAPTDQLQRSHFYLRRRVGGHCCSMFTRWRVLIAAADFSGIPPPYQHRQACWQAILHRAAVMRAVGNV